MAVDPGDLGLATFAFPHLEAGDYFDLRTFAFPTIVAGGPVFVVAGAVWSPGAVAGATYTAGITAGAIYRDGANAGDIVPE